MWRVHMYFLFFFLRGCAPGWVRQWVVCGSVHQQSWVRRKIVFSAYGKVGSALKSHSKQRSHHQTGKEGFWPVPRPSLVPAPAGDLVGLSLHLVPHPRHPDTDRFSSPVLLILPFFQTAELLQASVTALATWYLQRRFRVGAQKRPNKTSFIPPPLFFPSPLVLLVYFFSERGTGQPRLSLNLICS